MAPEVLSASGPPLNGHLCGMYGDAQEWAQLVTRFVREGLAAGLQVLYFCDAHTPPVVTTALEAGGVDVGAAVARGQLVVMEAAQSYLRQLPFDPDAVIAGCGPRASRA
ncbi:MEDS domain-containing protein [Streptacidiphilus sp. PAMC 29251]